MSWMACGLARHQAEPAFCCRVYDHSSDCTGGGRESLTPDILLSGLNET